MKKRRFFKVVGSNGTYVFENNPDSKKAAFLLMAQSGESKSVLKNGQEITEEEYNKG